MFHQIINILRKILLNIYLFNLSHFRISHFINSQWDKEESKVWRNHSIIFYIFNIIIVLNQTSNALADSMILLTLSPVKPYSAKDDSRSLLIFSTVARCLRTPSKSDTSF